MRTLTLKTERELKHFVKENRENIIKINDIKFSRIYPMLTISNKNAFYYSVDKQENILMKAPFTITLKNEEFNTIVAKCGNGKIYIDFRGSNYAQPAFIVISEKGFLTSTYNRKSTGIVTPGIELGSKVKKAINQKWINGHYCKIEKWNFVSALDAVKKITNMYFDGDLAANSNILF